jgi:ATP-dependent RNA helicase DeaD
MSDVDDVPTPTGPDGEATTDPFEQLGLRAELRAALDALGYEEPTPIQREAIPPLLAGRDLLGQAATGTGKTAAFALPLLHRLADGTRGRAPVGMILVPTRELAMQVSQAVHRYGRELGARVLPIYGGQPIGRQLKSLTRGVDVVVATPGRAVDHLSRGTLELDRLEVVILDEADEMLDMGFAEDLETILDATPASRQTMLFSATIPTRIEHLAGRHLDDPVRLAMGRSTSSAAQTPRIRQTAFVVPRAHKPAALGRILDVEAPDAALVFCGTRHEVEQLAETMNGRGYRGEALHGGMAQDQRDRVMDRLRGETADLVVATDVAARGLDIEHLTHVVNYDVPSAPESYVHRIGRVGRAGREGVAITLVEPRQHRMLRAIEKHVGGRMAVEKIPTVADLRARRLELTRAALHESLVAEDDLERFRVVVESLSDEFDLMDVALAAVGLAHEATSGADDDQELPSVRMHGDGEGGADGGGRRTGGPSGQRTGRDGGGSGGRGGRGRGSPARDMNRLFVSLGRGAGIRPKDLVGAIANETSLRGEQIGAIEITQNFSLVEVPADSTDEVVRALRATRIKGRKATVRQDRDSD